MKIELFLTMFGLIGFQMCLAQNKTIYKSWDPSTDSVYVLEGQAWPNEMKDYYGRLPARAESLVRPAVWSLSKNSAGLQLRFQTDAKEIVIKYVTSGNLQMAHMPATGVSGLDLYAKNIDGKWLWCGGSYAFGDTVIYRFKNLPQKDQHVSNCEYMLYLPLYNSVKWLHVEVPKDRYFKPLPVRKDLPIVMYGTSIMQGGCASRPGLAWPAILGRRLDRPVVNLGFSGNGRLEKEVIGLQAEINARLFVLDCLPNLTGVDLPDLKQRIVLAVKTLQEKRRGVPILLTAHAGYTDGDMNSVRKGAYECVNNALNQVFDSLSTKGIKQIYRLSKEELNLDIESTVDGTHPNDLGMMRYADAYEIKIRNILNETKGSIATTTPVTQRRDASIYDWETRHNAILEYPEKHSPSLVLIGNSITHYWGGKPIAPHSNGKESWDKFFSKAQTLNMGFGWDRIENVLWRVHHGELDGIKPKQIVLMIGTNNLDLNTDEDIVSGLKNLVNAIHKRQSEANILVMGIFPRRDKEQRILQLNRLIQHAFTLPKIKYADASALFVKQNKKIDESLFADGLHPNEAGYAKLGAFIENQIKMLP
ncbi:MAG: SGNH/GDSL hydrolase family protein [Sphingobacteriaceae bacterium]